MVISLYHVKGGELMYKELTSAKEDFLFAAKRAYDSGIQTGTGGNISTRIKNSDWMFVKASGISFGNSNADNLVITDFSGNVIEGGKPTRELYLHGALYQRYEHIGGIVHTHSPWSILASKDNDFIPLVTKHSKLKLKKEIPVIPVEAPAVGAEEIHKVFDILDKDNEITVFILRDHGIVAFAKDTKKAEEIAELIEETAQIFWLDRLWKKLK